MCMCPYLSSVHTVIICLSLRHLHIVFDTYICLTLATAAAVLLHAVTLNAHLKFVEFINSYVKLRIRRFI